LDRRLALYGGEPVIKAPMPPMFPGGMEIGAEEKQAVMEVLDRKYLFRYYGPAEYPSKVAEFERAFAARMGKKYALGLTNGTASLITALVAVGVGPGDEVIIPAYTFIASCAAVLAANALPVICEVDDSLTLDPVDLERKITPRTRAIMPVHMRGAGCDMACITAIARNKGIAIVEDTAQAMGGAFRGQPLGTFGDVGCYSLQYHKIITAGEGGALVTDDDRLIVRAMNYHDSAACWRRDRFAEEEFAGELFPGVNYRMSEITGALCLTQLAKLEAILGRMRSLKRRIKSQIQGIDGLAFRRLNDVDGDTGICLILFGRDAENAHVFGKALSAEGVPAGTMFDKGVPDWHVYAHWKHIHAKVTSTPAGWPYNNPFYKGPTPQYRADDCPRTTQILSRSIHISIPPQMTDETADLIALAIQKVARALA